MWVWFKIIQIGDRVLLLSLREISCPCFDSTSLENIPLVSYFLAQNKTEVKIEALTDRRRSLPCTWNMPESRLLTLRKESERFSIEIKEKEADNIDLRKQIREIKSTIHQTQRDYDATAKGTSKAENQRIKMQKLLKRQKVANEVNAQEKEIGELRLVLKRLSKKTFPQFDERI